MPKPNWRDFVNNVEKEENIDTLIEDVLSDISSLRPKTLNEDRKLKNLHRNLLEIKRRIHKMNTEIEISETKLSILEEGLGE
jgi:phage shock protein A